MASLTIKYLASGVFMIFLGIFLTAWTPTEIILYDRLYMRRGFLPFKWWQELSGIAELSDYQIRFFNVTNHEAFLNGSDGKLNFQEVGPFVFSDKIEHVWTTHNDNDTLTFGTKHNLIYEASKNSENLDARLILPNFPLLLVASMVSEMNMFYKLMFHGIYRSIRPKMFIETTPRNMLWNYSDPLVDKFKKFLPFVAPIKGEFGAIKLINDRSLRNVTVLIGPKNGHEKFFTIDNFDGSKYPNGVDPACKDDLTNASESQFPQYVKRTSHLKFFRESYCRYIDLFYDSDVSKYGVAAYKFEATTTFDRKPLSENDCYKGNPRLPNGVFDFSSCTHGLPFVLSYPHFWRASFTQNKITGFQYNATRKPGYIIVEPLSGAPLEISLATQLNIHVKNLTGIDDSLKVLQNLFLPVLWVKMHQTLPWFMAISIFLMARLAPILNVIICSISILAGGYLVYLYVKKSRNNYKEEPNIADEKQITDKLISKFS